MIVNTVLPIWRTIQERFYKTARSLKEQQLSQEMGGASIGYMLRHNAEVEYMFADWFFGKNIPEHITLSTDKGAAGSSAAYTNLEELVAFLTASNEHLIEAMHALPEEAWNTSVESPIGASTPLEAIGRLMYHTGIHAGQISLILKSGATKAQA